MAAFKNDLNLLQDQIVSFLNNAKLLEHFNELDQVFTFSCNVLDLGADT